MRVPGIASIALLARRSEGPGAPEPLRSLIALAGRLRRVEAIPEPPAGVAVRSVRSAAALRTLAERERLPVLHRFDAATGAHEFLLLTVTDGAYSWVPLDERTGHPDDGSLVAAGGRWR